MASTWKSSLRDSISNPKIIIINDPKCKNVEGKKKKREREREEEEEEMEMQALRSSRARSSRARPRPPRDLRSLTATLFFFFPSDEHIFSGIVVAVVVVVFFFVLFLDVNRVLETRFLCTCHVEKVPY